jgi:hypothetical protein
MEGYMNEENANQKGKTIQVLDKRRFDSAGQERPADAAPTNSQSNSATQKTDTAASSVEAQVSADNQGSRGFTMQESNDNAEAEPVAFTSFIMSLATQVLVQLGEMPPPQGMEIPLDLEAARQTIDIMTMLQRRTKGNLSAEETRFMEDVLHSLRISFINAKKKAS